LDAFHHEKMVGNGEELLEMAFSGSKRAQGFSKISSRKSSSHLQDHAHGNSLDHQLILPRLE